MENSLQKHIKKNNPFSVILFWPIPSFLVKVTICFIKLLQIYDLLLPSDVFLLFTIQPLKKKKEDKWFFKKMVFFVLIRYHNKWNPFIEK